MNFRLYLLHARRWAMFAVVPALVAGMLAYLYTAHEAKTYQASTTLYVESAGTSISGLPGGTDAYNSQLLTPSYIQMITDPVIDRTVDRTMAQRYPGYRLEDHGVATTQPATVQGSQLVNVTVTDTSPQRAAVAANAVATAFIGRIRAIETARFAADARSLSLQIGRSQANIQRVTGQINSYQGNPSGLDSLKTTLAAYQSTYQSLLASSESFNVTRDAAVNNVSVYSPAAPPTAAIGPHRLRTSALLAFLILLLGAAGITLYDYFDDSLRTPEEVEEITGAPILGTVQRFDVPHLGTQLITQKSPRSPISEAYRLIRTNLTFTNVDKPPRRIVVTSASPKEGKSTTASNLAFVLADAGQRVTLLDADLRRPSQHRIFDVERQEGLTNLLARGGELNGHGTQGTALPNLKVVASGPLPPKPADLLGSHQMQAFVTHVDSQSDVVLIDSPPVLAVADAAILSTVADGVILVVDPGKSRRRDVKRAREAIEAVGGTVIGVVINRLSERSASYYYYYYHYNYAYHYDQQYTSESDPADIRTGIGKRGASPIGRHRDES